MIAARQAAAAQLEQFRAEMVAEAAKMRAAVERQVCSLVMCVFCAVLLSKKHRLLSSATAGVLVTCV